MFITLEGPESTGKSSTIQLLEQRLNLLGKEVLVTKEPGSPHDEVCVEIRKLILDPGNELSSNTALLLFLADRAQHIENVIAPALDAGKIVISDRFSLSTLLYREAERVGDAHWLSRENNTLFSLISFAQSHQGNYLVPYMCFISNANYEWAKESMLARGRLDRIEQKGERFHKKVHELFNSAANNELGPIVESQLFYPNRVISLPQIPEHTTEEVVGFIINTLGGLIE